MSNTPDELRDWLKVGIKKGWISEPYCDTHDGGEKYQTEYEKEQWEEGFDPCQTVIRMLGVDE